MEESCALARMGLVPVLKLGEERPATEEDFKQHLPVSLSCLESLVSPASPLLPSTHLLLLLSQHSTLQTPSSSFSSTPWSSHEHQALALRLQEKLLLVSGLNEGGVGGLLTREDRKLFNQCLQILQPQLENLAQHPSSPHTLAWLVTRLSHPDLGQATPLFLPHTLRCLDSWLVPCRVLGCTIVDHLISQCPAAELAWYGRAELLHSALLPLLSQDSTCLAAASPSLLHLTEQLHKAKKDVPALPGPADTLLDRVTGLLQLETRCPLRRSLLVSLLQGLLSLLAQGAVRWVPRLAGLVAGDPREEVLQLVPSLCGLCPEAMALELATLLPSLLRRAHSLSYSPTPPSSSLTSALTALVSTSPAQAALLCDGLQDLKVNPVFDSLVLELLSAVREEESEDDIPVLKMREMKGLGQQV